MQLHHPNPEQLLAGLRALKMVGEARGTLHPTAIKLILAAQQHLAGTHIDLEELSPISPAELAEAIHDPLLSRQLVHGMVAVSLVDELPTAAQLELIQRFASAMGISSELVETFEKAVHGHMLAFRMCYLRRTHLKDFAKTQVAESGLLGTARAVATFAGLTEDKELSARYAALGQLPAGTLGRELHDYYLRNGFGWPGQKHGFPEAGVSHDVSHLISGYDTTPIGETLVAAFVSGYRQDPNAIFTTLFGIIIFDAGFQLPPGRYIAAKHDTLGAPDVAARMFHAIERGAAMNTDISVNFLVWPYVERTLEELRAEWNVPPEKPASELVTSPVAPTATDY